VENCGNRVVTVVKSGTKFTRLIFNGTRGCNS
jgi:hypothetical protein